MGSQSGGLNFDELRAYRKNALRAAKDLGYDESVSTDIKAAKTIDEISVIMSNARVDSFKKR